MDKQVIALGSINVDFQLRVERWPQKGETLPGTDLLIAGGGKAANVALQACRIGVRAALIGRIGDDPLSSFALQTLKKTAVNLRGVKAVENTNTGLASIFVRSDGEKTIILAPNANESWKKNDLASIDEIMGGAPGGSVLSVNLEIPEFVVDYSLKKAREKQIPVLLDPSPAVRMQQVWYPLVDFILPNQSELHALTGIRPDSLDAGFRAGQILNERGVGHVLVKMGGEGCAVITHGKELHIPAIRVNPVDTTGAGDSFAGALCASLVQGKSVEQSVRVAVVASALATTRYGSQNSYVTGEEIHKFTG